MFLKQTQPGLAPGLHSGAGQSPLGLERQLIRRSNPNAPLATKSSAPTNARVGRELAVFGSEAGLGSGAVGGGPAVAGGVGGGAGTSTNSTPTSGTGLGAGAAGA